MYLRIEKELEKKYKFQTVKQIMEYISGDNSDIYFGTLKFPNRKKLTAQSLAIKPDSKQSLLELKKPILKPESKKPAKPESKKSEKPESKKSLKNCDSFKKTVDPKCDKQPGCHWVVRKGCLKDSESTPKKSKPKLKPALKPKNCRSLKKTIYPEC